LSLSKKNFFIGENDFRVWLPETVFLEKSEDAYNSRKMIGVMSTSRKDRQGEVVVAKGLDFDDFLKNGHFNDNHSQETSAIVGYPEKVEYKKDLSEYGVKSDGWTCEGYVIKGTKRSDGIWELARALSEVPNKKLGFSIEGKVLRRADKTIEKAKIRNVAITNCPVNTDCTWESLEKSFYDPDESIKAMSAGYGVSPATQSGGGAVRTESLDSNVKEVMAKKKKREEALKRALDFEDMAKAMEWILESRPNFDEDAAAILVKHLFKKGGIL
jgi:hypothetical protein